MWKRPLFFLGLAFCILSGCSTLNESKLTREESRAIVTMARKKLTEAYPDLDLAAAQSIAQPPDSFSYYLLAGDYFQYFITWNVASNRFASVYGQGNIRQLENARVMLRSLPTREGIQNHP